MAETAGMEQYLIGCPDCGLMQVSPSLQGRKVAASCVRCGATLAREHSNPVKETLALTLAAILLAFPALLGPVFIVSAAGIVHESRADGTVIALIDNNFTTLGLIVGAFSIAFPVIWLLMLAVCLVPLLRDRRPPWLGYLFRMVGTIDLWAMPDVFVMGGFVAYTRLQAVATVQIGSGGWAYLAFAFACTAIRGTLDRASLWRRIMPDPAQPPENPVFCPHCTLVLPREAEGNPCPRCAEMVHARKPDAMARCAALVLASYLLYIPANLLPVLQTVRFGREQGHTIFHGGLELIQAGMWPLAIIVFLASIAVPGMKLLGLSWFLIATRSRSGDHLVARTRLYRFVGAVGRWSNIDVFMIGLLAALVQFGNLTTIRPAPGALAFAAVVVLTMLASHTFDSRLMWDAAPKDEI